MVLSLRALRTSVVAVSTLLSAATPFAQTSTETTSFASACKLANNLYTCNTASFQQALAQAKTAAIETGPVDPAAQAQLKKLFESLGKTEPVAGEPADLTFLLVPVDPQGVAFNTGDTQIAALHIFSRRSGTGRGDLIWAENFTGSQDLPWPIVVTRLISQFKAHFHIKDAPKTK
jgi:hypothetical protein